VLVALVELLPFQMVQIPFFQQSPLLVVVRHHLQQLLQGLLVLMVVQGAHGLVAVEVRVLLAAMVLMQRLATAATEQHQAFLVHL
jgi:hypothetical protein